MTATVAAAVTLTGVAEFRLVQHVPEQLACLDLLQDLFEQLYGTLELAGIDLGTSVMIPRCGHVELVVRAINLDGHDCLGKERLWEPAPLA
ncbi:hypothetical protein MAFF211271_06060 [Ralstonia syzygii subsp. indonesiensis]|nr:hypothetical protein MAFF211271_06060 [Ralstonia pseudosolanacearum]